DPGSVLGATYVVNNATDSSSSPLGSVMRAFNLSPGAGTRPGAVNLCSPARTNFTSCGGRWGAITVNVPVTFLVASGFPSSSWTYTLIVPFSMTNSTTIASSPRPTTPPYSDGWSPCAHAFPKAIILTTDATITASVFNGFSRGISFALPNKHLP